MANAAEVPAGQPALKRAGNSIEWSHPPAAPGWMAWTPHAAILWALAYGAVRVWWAARGAPSFGPLHFDLLFFSGWSAVSLCAAAAVVALALRLAPWLWSLLIAGWTVCLALMAACPLLLLDAFGALLPGLFVPLQPVAFLSRVACLVEAIFLGASSEAYRRHWCSACLICGRSADRVRLLKPPKWAWWAAYSAIAGCLVRIGAQAAIGFGMMRQPAGGPRMAVASLVFEALFLLAGTVMPLALVHSWGRVVPGWLPLLAGRRVPRWLLLGPAFAIGSLMTVYFTVTMVKITEDTIGGAWHQSFGTLPLAFFWVSVPGYIVWGLGLVVASFGYNRVTRSACRACGRQ